MHCQPIDDHQLLEDGRVGLGHPARPSTGHGNSRVIVASIQERIKQWGEDESRGHDADGEPITRRWIDGRTWRSSRHRIQEHAAIGQKRAGLEAEGIGESQCPRPPELVAPGQRQYRYAAGAFVASAASEERHGSGGSLGRTRS